MLMAAIRQAAAGARTLMEVDAEAARGIQGPATMDGIGPSDDWQQYWQRVDETRRRAAPWRAR
jgi:hypothetical protein